MKVVDSWTFVLGRFEIVRLKEVGAHRLRSVLVGAVSVAAITACDRHPTGAVSAAAIEIASGDGQTADPATTLPAPLSVRVLDGAGRPLAGQAVAWMSAAGVLDPIVSTTDDHGLATSKWTLGRELGVFSAIAYVENAPASRAAFSASTGASVIGSAIVSATEPLAFPTQTAMAMAANSAMDPIASSAARQVALGRPSSTAVRSRYRRLVVQYRSMNVDALNRNPESASESSSRLRTFASRVRQVAAPERIEVSPVLNSIRITLEDSLSAEMVRQLLLSDPAVAFVEDDTLQPMIEKNGQAGPLRFSRKAARAQEDAQGPGRAALGNDPLLEAQLWHYGLANLPRAWAVVTGGPEVLVAVVDNGVRFEHPDLSGVFTRDGYNFVTAGDRVASPQPLCSGGTTQIHERGYGPDPTAPDDLEFLGGCWNRTSVGDHGLHVSGTIGARGNDGVGVSGVNWQVRIRPIRVLDMTGAGSFFDVAQGILYAAGLPASDGNGGTVVATSRAPIINVSIGGYGVSSILQSAVRAATAAGSLIVAAVGNDGAGNIAIPAAYSEVLSVTAVGPDVMLARYSNVGPSVGITAPGGDFRRTSTGGIASTTWDFISGEPSYAFLEGTSMAAAHVSGIGALVLSREPTLSGTALRSRLEATALHLGAPGRDDRYGAGLVDAYRAVLNLTQLPRTTYVRIVDEASRTITREVATTADGSFAFHQLPEGRYFVIAGQDEGGDGVIGVPTRPFGWFGAAGHPLPIEMSRGHSTKVTFTFGLPLEGKPNSTLQSASELVIDGYLAGQVTASDSSAFFRVEIPKEGRYEFRTDAVLGACGYALELDPVITLLSAQGTSIAMNDDAGQRGATFCASIVRTLAAGTYFVRVSGSQGATGQYLLGVYRR